MLDLAPQIHRQRLVIEGLPKRGIVHSDIVSYLSGLSSVLDMHTLTNPVTHLSPQFGWAGWIHWETSGAHFYAWDEPVLFFSVDIYTCKAFDDADAVEYTQRFFDAERVEYKSF